MSGGRKGQPCELCGAATKRAERRFCSKSCSIRARGAKALGIVCSVDGCDRELDSLELCGMHYQRLRITGQTELRNEWRGLTTEQRFWKHVDIAGADDCWVWNSEVNNKGYGVFRIYGGGKAQKRYAHRMSLGLAEPFDEALKVLHSCDNPPCVNPAHLRAGTQLENIRDALAKGRLNLSGLELGWKRTGTSAMERARMGRREAA